MRRATTGASYVNVETAQTAREDVDQAVRTILQSLANEAEFTLGEDSAAELVSRSLEAATSPHLALRGFLTRWAAADPRPLVLLIDEIDALVGDSLVSVLRQLRVGYVDRPERFPQSVVLCGIRDVRDYRIHASSEKEVITGGSAFNIKAKSLRMGDFGRDEVEALLGQHTAETGQRFTFEAVAAVWDQTRGQPWLVNALAKEMCFEHEELRLRDRPLGERDVFEAREALILRRETHLDQLTDKLREPRVRRVIEPLLSGGDGNYGGTDREYVRDLGLVAADHPLRIANPIYGEVLPRVLTWVLQDEMPQQNRLVRPRGRHARHGRAAGRIPGLLPAELGALDPEGPVPRGRAPARLAGLPAPRGERDGADRAGVRLGEPAGGPAGHLAGRGPRREPVRGRVQAGPGRSRADHRQGAGADGRLHGHERRRRRPPRRLRHARGQELGGPGVPRGARARREADHRLGGLRR